jgi:hypothetical protein
MSFGFGPEVMMTDKETGSTNRKGGRRDQDVTGKGQASLQEVKLIIVCTLGAGVVPAVCAVIVALLLPHGQKQATVRDFSDVRGPSAPASRPIMLRQKDRINLNRGGRDGGPVQREIIRARPAPFIRPLHQTTVQPYGGQTVCELFTAGHQAIPELVLPQRPGGAARLTSASQWPGISPYLHSGNSSRQLPAFP